MSELVCLGCGGRLIKWGGYWRWLRQRLEVSRAWVARRRCTGCGMTLGLLPPAALERRLDAVETVGHAVVRRISGASIRTAAGELGLPATTVGDWLRRHRERAPELERELTRWAIGMGAQPPWDRPRNAERAAVTALGWRGTLRVGAGTAGLAAPGGSGVPSPAGRHWPPTDARSSSLPEFGQRPCTPYRERRDECTCLRHHRRPDSPSTRA